MRRLLAYLTVISLLTALRASAASLPSWIYTATDTELRNPQVSALLSPPNDLILGGAFSGTNGAITRIDDSGTLVWTKPAVTTSVGNGFVCGGIAPDPDGNTLVLFEFNGILTLGPSTFTNAGNGYAFVVAKLDPAGNPLWGRVVNGAWGGSPYPAGQLRVDPLGNAYVFFDHTGIVTAGNLTASADAYGRTTVLKISPTGTPVWMRDVSSAGAQGYVRFDSISVDTNAVYVTGFFNKYVGWGSTNISATALTSFVGRMNAATGNPEWIRNTGAGAQGSECALAPGGILWAKLSLVGSWTLHKYLTNGTLLASVPNLNHSGKLRILPSGQPILLGTPAYFASFDTNGNLTYSTTNAGSLTLGVTNATSFEVNAEGDAYIVGNLSPTSSKIVAAKIRAPGLAPEITTQPPSITNQPSVFSSFFVSLNAIGAAPLSYQWRLNGTNIPDTNARALTRTNITPAESGSYDCVVSNNYGSVTSRVYKVAVSAAVNFVKVPASQLVLLNGATLGGTNIQGDDCTVTSLAGKTLSCVITNQATDWPSQGLFDFQISSFNGFGGSYTFPTDGVFGSQSGSYNLGFNASGAVYLSLNRFPSYSSNSIIRFYASGYYTLEASPNTSNRISRGTYRIQGGDPTALFTVAANAGYGVSSLGYQWQKDGSDLPNATNTTLSLSSVKLVDAGRYSCVVTAYNADHTTSFPVASPDALLHVVARVEMPPASYTLAPGGSTLNISWGSGYVLQFTPTLSPPAWTTVATESPFNAPTTSGQGYFQVVQP